MSRGRVRRSLFAELSQAESSQEDSKEIKEKRESKESSSAMEVTNPWFASSGMLTPTLTVSDAYQADDDRMEIDEDELAESLDTVIDLQRSESDKSTKTDCEYENIFAELLAFAAEAIYQFGSMCPKNSPAKRKPISLPVIQEKWEDGSMDIMSSSISIFRHNKSLSKLGEHNGANYTLLISKVSLLEKQLKGLTIESFQAFIEKSRPKMFEAFIKKLQKNLNPMQLVVFLKLASKYPLFPVDSIYSALRFNKEMDIYLFYKTYDKFLYSKTLTADAAAPYLEKDLPVFRLGGKY